LDILAEDRFAHLDLEPGVLDGLRRGGLGHAADARHIGLGTAAQPPGESGDQQDRTRDSDERADPALAGLACPARGTGTCPLPRRHDRGLLGAILVSARLPIDRGQLSGDRVAGRT
jgi:hypothetical protein